MFIHYDGYSLFTFHRELFSHLLQKLELGFLQRTLGAIDKEHFHLPPSPFDFYAKTQFDCSQKNFPKNRRHFRPPSWIKRRVCGKNSRGLVADTKVFSEEIMLIFLKTATLERASVSQSMRD